MFDFSATEFLVIAMVALIVIGPRELPGLLRQFGQMVGKLRRMAGDFQEQFSQALADDEVQSLKKDMAEIADQTKLDVDFNPIEDAEREIRNAVGDTDDPEIDDDGFSAVPDDPGFEPEAGNEKEAGKTTSKTATKTAPASGAKTSSSDATTAANENPGKDPAGKDNAIVREPSEPRTAAPAKRLPVTTGTTKPAGSVAAEKRNSDGKPTAVES